MVLAPRAPVSRGEGREQDTRAWNLDIRGHGYRGDHEPFIGA